MDVATVVDAVEAHVRRSIAQLEATHLGADEREGHLKIVGAVYELDTGKVRQLAPR